MEIWKFFKAPWCTVCPAVEAALIKICEELPTVELQEFDVNTPEGRAEAGKYHVMALPTWVVLEDDVLVQTSTGSSIVKAARARKGEKWD